MKEVNGTSQKGLKKLFEEINEKGLGATRGCGPKWVNPDRAQCNVGRRHGMLPIATSTLSEVDPFKLSLMEDSYR